MLYEVITEKLMPYIDAFSIDLKGFTQEFYKGMTAANLEPRITSYNVCYTKLLRMLGLMSIEGEDRHYYNKIKYIEFIHFIDKLLEKKTALKEEIYFNKINKHYIMEGKYLGLREHYLVTLKDVSKSREIMEISYNFV